MKGERRLVERALLRWTKMAEGRRFPRLDEINDWMVGEDWANCLLIAVQSPIELSHFTAVGEKPGGRALPWGHIGRRSPVTSAVGRILPLLSNGRGRGNAAKRPNPLSRRAAPIVRRRRRDRPRAWRGEP